MAPERFYAECLQAMMHDLNNSGNEFFYPNVQVLDRKIRYKNVEIKVVNNGLSKSHPYNTTYVVNFSDNRNLQYSVHIFNTTDDVNLTRRGVVAGFTYLATTPNVGVYTCDVDLSKPF
ncbi:hypothetical protein BD413DRAFT_60918 [Trametes elegans]|nr:hypothetical protein BD413DRAFT_60918 [Trametes elegans]